MRLADTAAKMAVATVLGCASFAPAAQAAPFNDLFVFGDSYSDTGSFSVATNGTTAVGYLAQDLGITLTTTNNPNPGTNGVNFAESGALITRSPAPPTIHPRGMDQQVAEFQNDVTSGVLTFNPNTSLFLLFGGLNNHTMPVSDVTAAVTAEVGQLYALGARYMEIGVLPTISPFFADSAAILNPVYAALVPQLEAQFSDTHITLSNWGLFYDSALANASQYGFTNTDPTGCYDPATGMQTCPNPSDHFFYIPDHPSTAVHKIVGDDLYQEALALPPIMVPEPTSLAILGVGLLGLALTRRRGEESCAPSDWTGPLVG